MARLLREQVRANDVLAQDALTDGWRELHARFGGDEFCFLLAYPRLVARRVARSPSDSARLSKSSTGPSKTSA